MFTKDKEHKRAELGINIKDAIKKQSEKNGKLSRYLLERKELLEMPSEREHSYNKFIIILLYDILQELKEIKNVLKGEAI